jgi:hypothetical protein
MDDLITWEDKVNNPELVAFLEQYGEEEYLTAVEINLVRDAINFLNAQKVTNTRSKIYAAGELQIFKVAPNTNVNALEVGDYCLGFVEGQFINANYLGGNIALLSSFNIYT